MQHGIESFSPHRALRCPNLSAHRGAVYTAFVGQSNNWRRLQDLGSALTTGWVSSLLTIFAQAQEGESRRLKQARERAARAARRSQGAAEPADLPETGNSSGSGSEPEERADAQAVLSPVGAARIRAADQVDQVDRADRRNEDQQVIEAMADDLEAAVVEDHRVLRDMDAAQDLDLDDRGMADGDEHQDVEAPADVAAAPRGRQGRGPVEALGGVRGGLAPRPAGVSLPKPAVFTGDDRTVDARTFLSVFERYARFNRLEGLDRCLFFAAFLQGSAAVFFELLSQDVQDNWDALRAAFLANFGPDLVALRRELARFKRLPSEPVADCARRFQALLRVVDPRMAEADRVLKFIEAFDERTQEILLAYSSDRTTLVEIVAQANRVDTLVVRRGVTATGTTTSRASGPATTATARPAYERQAPPPGSRDATGSRGGASVTTPNGGARAFTGECFLCGQSGHRRAQCPQLPGRASTPAGSNGRAYGAAPTIKHESPKA